MIGRTQSYKVVKPFGMFKLGQILTWDIGIAKAHVMRGTLEPVAGPLVSAIETAMIDPDGEKAVKPRGRPRKRRAKPKAVTNADA